MSKYLILGLAFFGVFSFSVFPCLQAEQSFSFFIGVVVSMYKLNLQKLTRKKALLLALLLFVLGVLMLQTKQLPQIRAFGENSFPMKIVQLIMKSSLALSLIIIANLVVESYRVNWLVRFLSLIGAYSLEVYLVQMIFYNSIHRSWLKLVFFLIVTVGISVTVHSIANLCSNYIRKVVKRK